MNKKIIVATLSVWIVDPAWAVDAAGSYSWK